MPPPLLAPAGAQECAQSAPAPRCSQFLDARKLSPLHVFANAIFQRTIEQRIVPYVGGGLLVMRYEQKVDFQNDIEGRTDLGWSARAGVRFRIKTHEPSGTSSGGPYWRALAFLEAQHMSAEVDDIDLGGDAVVVGFRMEFDLN